MNRHDDSPRSVMVGLIGCGHIARAVHLPLLNAMAGVTVAALADPDAAQLAAAAAMAPDAARYDDAGRLLDGAAVDAVVIAAPTALHADLAVRAIRAGRHIYLEKPLAASLIHARRVVEAWRPSGLVGMIGFNYRFHPLYQQLRHAIVRQQIGRVVAVRSVFTTAAGIPPWKQRRATGGGALLDLASHEIDLVRFVLDDEIASVSAILQSRGAEHDTLALQMQTRGGVNAQVFCAFGAAEEAAMELWGEAGRLSVSRYGSVVPAWSPAAAQGPLGRLAAAARASLGHAPAIWRRLRSRGADPSYAAALASFVEAIGNAGPAAVDFNHGLRVHAVIDAAERSAATGAAVLVSDPIAPPTPTLAGHRAAAPAQEQFA